MPSARAIVWMCFAAVVAACETLPAPDPLTRLMPREIRSGAADMALTSVEQDVPREEVAQAVGALVAQAPVCLAWPTLWLEGSDRRSVYLARFDLMARDWGAEVATESRSRMQDFVDMGFLTMRERSEIGPNVVEYSLTREGSQHLQGTPYGGSGRPSFCSPSQRRLVEITNLEWGQFTCGSLRVQFTHVADAWPDWARTERTRAYLAATWAPIGAVSEGSVSLARQWFRHDRLPRGARNGELRSVCYDAQRERVAGDDLQLQAVGSPP